MKNEKPRGTMLTSTAAILCCLTFAAGFLCGDIVNQNIHFSPPPPRILRLAYCKYSSICASNVCLSK